MNIWSWLKGAVMGMKDELGFEILKTGAKEIFTMIVGKAKKEVASAIGATTDEARKSFDDEGEYLRSILNEVLGKRKAQEALDFEGELRRKNPKLAEAYVLALAKLAKQFEEGSRESGSASIVKLVQLLLERKTFKERVAFIKGRGIEALISPLEKELLVKLGYASLGELREDVKKITNRNARKLQKRLKKDPYKGFWTEALGFSPMALVPGFMTKELRMSNIHIPLPGWMRRRTP